MSRKRKINRRKFLGQAVGMGALALAVKEAFGEVSSPSNMLEMLMQGQATPFSLKPISTGFNDPIGIDYHPVLNKVVVSVNYPSGMPNNFELIGEDGTHSAFSNISGLTDEVKIAIAQDDGGGRSIGGFGAGELFCGTGIAGQILKISSDGSRVENPWVGLPNESGLLRGSLHVDRTGVFEGDLIVVTTTGGVWRVKANKEARKLADLGTHLEGLITVPEDEEKYGPWSGKILVGAEEQSRLYTVDTVGKVESYTLEGPGSNGAIKPEDIDIVARNENFFGVDYTGRRILGLEATAFREMEGDILVSQEFPGYLYRIHWNKLYFEVTQLAEVAQWEHMTFSKSGIVEVASIGKIEFTSGSYEVGEADSVATINVKRTSSATSYASVDYTTIETGAVSPTHFLSTSGRLVFAPGETTKSFSVRVVDNNLKDCDKRVEVRLSNPTQATLGTISSAMLSIRNND